MKKKRATNALHWNERQNKLRWNEKKRREANEINKLTY